MSKKKTKSKSKFNSYVPLNVTIESASMTRQSTMIRPLVTPSVYYTEEVDATIRFLVDTVTTEVGWLGLVEKVGFNFLVTKIFVPKQTVSAANTTITAASMADIAMEILDLDLNPDDLYYWGHSHVNMGVSPSVQDEWQLEEYLAHCPVFIRGIYNKREQAKVDVYDMPAGIVHQCVNHGTVPSQLSSAERTRLKNILKRDVNIYVPPKRKGMGAYASGAYSPGAELSGQGYYDSAAAIDYEIEYEEYLTQVENDQLLLDQDIGHA